MSQPANKGAKRRNSNIEDTPNVSKQIIADLRALKIRISTTFLRFLERLNMNFPIDVVLNKNCRYAEQFISSIVLAVRYTQPAKLAIALVVTSDLTKLREVDDRIVGYANAYASLEDVSLTEKIGQNLEASTSFIPQFLQILVVPSIKNLRHLKMLFHSGETVMTAMEQLRECQLLSIHISINNNLERFQAVLSQMNLKQLREFIVERDSSTDEPHLADVLPIIAKASPMLERLSSNLLCPNRKEEVIKAFSQLKDLEQLIFSSQISFSVAQWEQLYNNNLFLVDVRLINKWTPDHTEAERRLIHLFMQRKDNYNNAAAFAFKLESSDLDGKLRIEDMMNIFEYMALITI